MHTEICGLTLIVQLEDAHAAVRHGAVVDRQSVGGAADHLTLHQQRVIGQHQQGATFVRAPDGQLLALRQVHTLHLNTQEDTNPVTLLKMLLVSARCGFISADIATVNHIKRCSGCSQNKTIMGCCYYLPLLKEKTQRLFFRNLLKDHKMK